MFSDGMRFEVGRPVEPSRAKFSEFFSATAMTCQRRLCDIAAVYDAD